jgi:cell division protein FtsZ
MVQLNRSYDRNENPGEPITIKVVGVGGAGSNILDRVMLDGIESADLAAINTDVQSLTASVAAHKIQLGRTLTRGLGSGGDPELGLAAAEEATEEIRSVLRSGAIVFICVGLGGGTGSGAAPIVAQVAKEENALVLVFAALPFGFEGRRRCAQAEESLARLRAYADAVICFENDRMAEITLPRMGIHEAFAAADLTISQSIRSVAHLLQSPGLLHIGFDDVRKVLKGGDARGLFGFGEAEGENRAHDALGRALKNPLMNRGDLLEKAHHALVHIQGGTSVTLGEVQIIMEELNRHINDRTQLFMGIGIDARMGNRLSVSILSSLGDGSGKPIAVPKRTYEEELIVESASKPALKPARANVSLPEESLRPVSRETERPRPIEELSGTHSNEHSVAREGMDHKSASKIVPTAAVANPAQQPRSAPGPEPSRAAIQQPARPGSMKPDLKAAGDQTSQKKAEAKQETLQFEPVSRGRFDKSEPTIIDGQDLDVPTFLRKNVKVR